MCGGRAHPQTAHRRALRAALAQEVGQLPAGDRQQPGAHLLAAVGAHPGPSAPRLRERLRGEFDRDLGVECPAGQKQKHELGLLSVEGDEAVGVGHHL